MSVSRIVGYSFILIGCSGLGLWYSMQMQQRVRHLREMIRVLDIVISEIDYGNSTLPECCERVQEKAAAPYDAAFAKICDRIRYEDGCDFGKICADILHRAFQGMPVKEEKDVFIHCFTDVGYADEWVQKRNVERGKKDLQHILCTEEADLKKRSKMAVSLGTMSGILLVLILL